jgi:AraC-like DNA-binding protein
VIVAAVVAAEVVAASLLLRVVIPAGSHLNYDAYRIISLIEVGVGTALLLWLARGGVGGILTPPRARKAAATEPGDGDRAALARLTALMEGERLYREPGLSLRQLADRAGLPEYRLRRLIHEGLGFRNFNAFLHAHRVKDACARLDDPGQRRTPILTIALDAGYQSLNTFNRGFRETMGITPSAYRRAREET